jgi:hypothetical protein
MYFYMFMKLQKMGIIVLFESAYFCATDERQKLYFETL